MGLPNLMALGFEPPKPHKTQHPNWEMVFGMPLGEAEEWHSGEANVSILVLG